ncbi:hypothetical protein TNCV_819011 [Trichonephila clavipes]|nr:hypothetical protein TNCV_819011 [Trichonephila clavipes]
MIVLSVLSNCPAVYMSLGMAQNGYRIIAMFLADLRLEMFCDKAVAQHASRNTYGEWYRQQSEFRPTQLLLRKRIRALAAKKQRCTMEQRKISDYFSQ